ncbi:dye decolorizing peroxidase [Mycolicibacterium iranicum]|uniref:Dye decolorizing peroxidase n=1 Tax=Mycolicibacterium iranicum TaxID=912594 RepID=A0A839QAH9_MYCIR|nr:Dyp-type peroxidase [Mycolicibacterium iranicum]MBB2991465.1 dye decolorizing peroxidase [Mycolicibacterium iranicum]
MGDRRWAVNRRRLLTGGAALAATGALTGCVAGETAAPAAGFGSDTEPFHGVHQAGVDTPPQAHGLFVALDLRAGTGREARDALTSVLRLWSADAARLTQGDPALADTEPELAHRPARLSVTVGLGPHTFDRIGLADRRPVSAADLPPFGTDRLDERWCGGEILLQICADDPVVVAHTARVLLKNVRTLTTQRWRQNGFRPARGADTSGATMRNLMGQVDGTANLRTPDDVDRHVWDDGSDQSWFAGGTVLVLRRIRAELDTWDELDRASKELTVGRRLSTGAPLTGRDEFDEPDFGAAENGIPVIPPNSHVALARHRAESERFLRRAYNYDDPPRDGTTDAGLIFAAYQRDPSLQFVPVQRRLAEADALNPWITTVGSAVFAVLPGVPEGGYLGRQLLQ